MRQSATNVVLMVSVGLIGVIGGATRMAAQAGGAAAQGAATKTAAVKTPGAPGGAVARGKYLVETSGCHDCHTPWTMGPNGPGPDMSRPLSGHPASATVPPPFALTN